MVLDSAWFCGRQLLLEAGHGICNRSDTIRMVCPAPSKCVAEILDKVVGLRSFIQILVERRHVRSKALFCLGGEDKQLLNGSRNAVAIDLVYAIDAVYVIYTVRAIYDRSGWSFLQNNCGIAAAETCVSYVSSSISTSSSGVFYHRSLSR